MSEAVCTYFPGNHQMRANGFAFLADQDNNRIHWEGPIGQYKCKCGNRFICEGSPEAGAIIGKYVTEGGIIRSGQVQGIGVLVINKNLIYETTARTLPGFTFLHGNAN